MIRFEAHAMYTLSHGKNTNDVDGLHQKPLRPAVSIDRHVPQAIVADHGHLHMFLSSSICRSSRQFLSPVSIQGVVLPYVLFR